MARQELRTKPETLKPILRWVGGKQYLLPQLLELMPPDGFGRYIEPFLGAASVFLALQPREAVLGDANAHLIDTYAYIRKYPQRVAAYLRRLIAIDSPEAYYEIRRTYNKSEPSAAQAARFIYLNRTCFNGVFRVNTSGQFNVPYGHKKKTPRFPTPLTLKLVADAFQGVRLVVGDYRTTLQNAKRGDFVYLDPPYPALNGTSFFAHYTMDRFPAAAQEALAEQTTTLHQKGCLIMMSNADTPRIRNLYKHFDLHRVAATRYVTCKSTKHRVHELVIRNYA